MMVGRDVQLQVDKKPAHPGDVVLDVEGVTIHNDQRKKDSVKDVTFQVHAGEIVCRTPSARSNTCCNLRILAATTRRKCSASKIRASVF